MTRRFTHLPHRDAMIRHAIKRFWQRRGVVLSAPEYESMVATIRENRIQPCAVTGRGARVYAITHRKVTAYAIWCAEHACIVTFYPNLRWIERDGGIVLREAIA